MLKAVARLALVVAALVFVSTAVSAQAPSTVRLSPQAVHVLDSIADKSRTERVETAACVTDFVREPFTINALGPATYTFADSLSIHTANNAPLCGFLVPTIHTHVAKNGILYEPSGVDKRSKLRDAQPFALILVVLDSAKALVIY